MEYNNKQECYERGEIAEGLDKSATKKKVRYSEL